MTAAEKSGQLARMKQREWKKHRLDTIEAAPSIAAPGFTRLGYFLSPRLGRGSSMTAGGRGGRGG
jgi:hypothetical protein